MNKVLIKLYVPLIEKKYELWIPINKRIYNIIALIVKAINELNDYEYQINTMPLLYNRKTAKEYNVNSIIKETDIRNGTELILM